MELQGGDRAMVSSFNNDAHSELECVTCSLQAISGSLIAIINAFLPGGWGEVGGQLARRRQL